MPLIGVLIKRDPIKNQLLGGAVPLNKQDYFDVYNHHFIELWGLYIWLHHKLYRGYTH